MKLKERLFKAYWSGRAKARLEFFGEATKIVEGAQLIVISRDGHGRHYQDSRAEEVAERAKRDFCVHAQSAIDRSLTSLYVPKTRLEAIVFELGYSLHRAEDR